MVLALPEAIEVAVVELEIQVAQLLNVLFHHFPQPPPVCTFGALHEG